MVLPEKLVGLGLSLSSMMSPTDAVSHKALKLRDLNDLAGSSTTDLVRFSGTLKVARGIVEEHRRSEIIEVPTSGLISILDRIKALEKEVQDLIDGKGVSGNSKAIESSASGSASGGSASSSPSAVSSGGSSSDGGGSGSNAGSSSSGIGSSNSKSVSGDSGSGTSGSGSGSPSKDSPSGSTPSGSSPSATSSDTGSSGGSSDNKDDCAPEHLLYRLGGASLQRRSMTSVSAHPLFRRTTNCTLDSVSGGGKKESTALPSGAAVFKESSSSSGADGSTDGPGADPSGAPSSASADGGNSASVTSPPPAATASPGLKVKGNPESDEKDATVTTTMTSTSYSTVTVRLSLSASTKAGSHGKYLNTTGIPDRLSSAGQLFSNVTTALATESEATTPTSTALSGKSRFAQSNATLAIEAASASPSSLVDNESISPVAPSSDSTTTPLSTGDDDLTATNSSATAAISPTIGDANSKALQAPNQQKNLTLPSAAAADTPAAATSSSIIGPDSTPQSLAESNNTTATVAPIAGSPISELSSPSSLQDDISSLASTNSSSAVAPENAAVPESPAKTTSTITSTVSITVPAGRSTIGADVDPEATTASAPLAPPVNGTLEKRQSGFRTMRSLRRKTAAADDRR